MAIDKILQEKIIKTIIKMPDFEGPEGILAFLDRVWPLRSIPSEDSRFKDAYGDIRQHMVNNQDWTMDYLFFERLGILHNDESFFVKFLETVVLPISRDGLTDIRRYVDVINTLLANTNFALRITGYMGELPIYTFSNKSVADKNFSIQLLSYYRFQKASSQNETYPHFALYFDNWNDFGYVTSMELKWWPEPGISIKVGNLRIMSPGNKKTWDVLPDEFQSLPEEFCSLGYDDEYYYKLKELFPITYHNILYALRDAAIFPSIGDKFKKDPIFEKSLLRENHNEQLWRTIRFDLEDIVPDRAFQFSFQFKPPYASESVFLDFEFEYTKPIEHRIYAVIGKNGTGKTKILSSIAQELSLVSSPLIGKKPLFGKITSISYSFFDNFDIPVSNDGFHYAYCGLKKDKSTQLTSEELDKRFMNSVITIWIKNEIENWISILKNFIDSPILERIITPLNVIGQDGVDYNYHEKAARELKEQLSSGQHILLYVLTELIAQIRENSLILYDEPETHLHPNAITELMNSIQDLVTRYNSFCIVGTHSPLVVQCILSRNVYVLVRDGDQIYLQKLERESFGENLTVITDDIFGTKEIPKNYLNLFDELKEKGFSFNDIILMFEQENELPMNLNTKLYLKSLFK